MYSSEKLEKTAFSLTYMILSSLRHSGIPTAVTSGTFNQLQPPC